MSHLDEWHLFSNRHGKTDPVGATRGGKFPWASRHAMIRADANVRHWCKCPGTQPNVQGSTAVPCAQAVTQEDGLCDECRLWCVAIDSAGNYHQLASLWA